MIGNDENLPFRNVCRVDLNADVDEGFNLSIFGMFLLCVLVQPFLCKCLGTAVYPLSLPKVHSALIQHEPMDYCRGEAHRRKVSEACVGPTHHGRCDRRAQTR